MGVHVWKAEPHEAETVARLLVAFRDHYGRDWPSANAFLAGVERLIETPDCEFLLAAADEDSPPEGVCQIRFRFGIWHASTDCWLEDLFVLDSARGAGLGRALVEAVLDSARARGSRRVELDVSESNDAALALYRSLGFGFKSDPDRDLLMRRPLSDDQP